MKTNRFILIILLTICCFTLSEKIKAESQTINIFNQAMIHFNQDSMSIYNTEDVKSFDNGREIQTRLKLPKINQTTKITGHLEIIPIPKDHLSVHDSWDRAGNIRLSIDEMANIELIKFVTAYGGYTEYDVDLSHLAPLLQGEVVIKGFIDTWVSPGWKVNFSLTFETVEDSIKPAWNQGLVFIESFNKEEIDDNGLEIEVIIPQEMKRVLLYYLVSGHCTDGRDADEFISKDNVISVDGQVVYRYQPWRNDCRQFREINPYTKRWSSGYWSSDFSRSGWCPGDWVEPLVIDLSDHLTPGKHTVTFRIENIRPKDENDNFGYWRVSSYLTGWKEYDIFKYNEE